MKKLILFSFLLISSLCYSQTTNVTATVTYPDGNAFINGTVQAVFTPPTGIIDQHLYLLNGSPFPYFVNGTLDNTGTFTLALTDDHVVRPQGGRWSFNVCSPATVPCTISLQDVFGSSLNLSAAISADAAPIFAPALTVPTYFQDSEVDANSIGGQLYFNYITAQLRCWNGFVFSNCLGGGGGSGTVTSFSAGNLSPLFTTSIATPTTTPVLSFILIQAPAHTVFGNYTGSSAVPIYNPLTFLGSTTQVGTTTGSYTANDCVKVDASNNFIDAGAPCGSGSGGGTPGGPQFSIQFNNPLGVFDGVSGLTTDILGNLTGLSLSTTGTNGGYWLASEGTDPSLCASNKDLIYANATNHAFQLCNNGGTQDKIAAVNGAVTSGHMAVFNGTSYEITDGGVPPTPGTNCLTDNNHICVYDEFVGSTTQSSLGWIATGGGGSLATACSTSTCAVLNEVNHPGLYMVSAGATQWEYYIPGLANSGGEYLNPLSQTFKLSSAVNDQSDVNGRIRFGMFSDRGRENQAVGGVWFDAVGTGSNPNWFCWTQNQAGTLNSADSGVNVSANSFWHTLEIDAAATTSVVFKIDGTTVCGGMTQNYTSIGFLTPGYEAAGTTGNGHNVIDFFRLDMTLSGR